MSYKIEKLPNEPILLCVVNADYSAAAEAEQFVKEILKTLDAQPESLYMLFDTSNASINLDDILQGTKLATQQNQLFKHVNVREAIFVTPNRFMKLVIQGLNNPMFGNLKIHQADSFDAALTYARTQAAARP